MSVRSKQNFDFDVIKHRTGDFDPTEEQELALKAIQRDKQRPADDEPQTR